MSTQPSRAGQQTNRPVVKGSWEDLLAQAHQKAINHNDEAIPLYQKLVDRLARLPENARRAGNNRLQDILLEAANHLQSYLLIRDRYDEALALIQQLQKEIDLENRRFWARHEADVLMQAGRFDQALARLEELAGQEEAAERDFIHWIFSALEIGRLDAARKGLEALEQFLLSPERAEAEEEEPHQRELLLLHQKLLVAMEAGEWEQGIAYYEEANRLSSSPLNPFLVYTRLILQGRYEEALPFINRDPGAIRAHFWRGLTYQLLGRPREAQEQWKQAVRQDLSQNQERAILEFTLSQYYLGDPEDFGLSTILSVLRGDREPNWILLWLAGVGWAIRNNLESARTNMEVSLRQLKAQAAGRRFPYRLWFMSKELYTPEQREALAPLHQTTPTLSPEAQP